jgi:quercetin dioxygenase-like cupin family protein
VWTTETVPADNSGDQDAGAQPVGTTLQGGTVFRLIEFAPGVAPRRHRTESVDYGVIVSGEIEMELDDSVVHLAAGDVFVQRGTVHNWVNRSERPCIMAVVLVSAQAVRLRDHSLNAIG